MDYTCYLRNEIECLSDKVYGYYWDRPRLGTNISFRGIPRVLHGICVRVYLGAYFSCDGKTRSAIGRQCQANQCIEGIEVCAVPRQEQRFSILGEMQDISSGIKTSILYSQRSWLCNGLPQIRTMYVTALKYLFSCIGVHLTKCAWLI